MPLMEQMAMLFADQNAQAKTECAVDEGTHTVVAALNAALGLRRGFSPKGRNAEFIRARLREGYTVEDLLAVVYTMVRLWGRSPKMRPYLRPQTLFRPRNFESYLALAEAESEVYYAGNFSEQSFRERA